MQQQLTRPRAALVGTAAFAAVTLAACSGTSAPPAGITAPQPSASVVAAKAAAHPTCPLTGLPPSKHQNISRPPLAVKIDNVSDALPQSGVNSADIVVEELVEGGLTRLMAIFQCDKAATVGPIRSARISDADILALLHGSVLGFSGANPADLPPIEAHGDTVLISQDSDPQYFYRSDARPAPHNVFSSTKRMLHAGIAARHNLKAPKPLFTYGVIDPAAKRAHQVSLNWPAASALWTWSGNHWLRTQDGSVDRLSSGAQVSATNVVVMSVDIASTGLHDVLGNASPLDVTVGSNKVWVFRNGKMVKGTWSRPKVTSGLTLRDKAGHVIALAPGRTWIELLPKPGKPSR
jgi:Protein of unknown function (DUF3048) N-terminal domain/Protein of unknown function (DUF3048) C-terminal domain